MILDAAQPKTITFIFTLVRDYAGQRARTIEDQGRELTIGRKLNAQTTGGKEHAQARLMGIHSEGNANGLVR